MSTVTTEIAPKNVLDTLGRHMLVDGYHVVMDLDRSRGSIIYDSLHDVEVLDLFSHFATIPVGYNHPKLKDPAFLEELHRAALTKPANSDIYTREMARFVETFARVAVPDTHSSHLFFVEGGSVGVENALKTAFDWKVRKNFRKGYRREVGHQVIHFEQAFHGRTGYTLSLTNTDPRKTMYFPKFPWPRIVNPKLRFPVDEAEVERVKKVEALALAQVKQALADNRDDVAALIIEPIQAEGGDNHFRPEFLAALRRLCDESEMLFIFDEVQTGIGLTGSMWGFQTVGVTPDLFAFGKKMQVCGFASNQRIFDEPENVFNVSSRINSTWGGNLVDMVRARRYLEIIEEEDLVENARVVGGYLQEKLQELAAEFPGKVGNVRGKGLFIAFDLPDGPTRGKVLSTWLQKHAVMGLASGENAIRLRPALTLTKEDALLGVQRLRLALTEVLG
jgi:L-lysine 6-transaminase